jgi:hypothetical protein
MLPDIFPLGPFLVEADGKLSFRREGTSPSFSFIWRERRFSAVLQTGVMRLTGVIGQVPSSAGGKERRDAALAALRMVPRLLPHRWVLRLRPDHRLLLEVEQPMDWPAHISALLQPLVGFLLAIAPYLDLVEEADLG